MIQMRKKGSPHLVQIAPDPADNHFTVVSLIKISTGQIKGSHYILTADTAQWVRRCLKLLGNRGGGNCLLPGAFAQNRHTIREKNLPRAGRRFTDLTINTL